MGMDVEVMGRAKEGFQELDVGVDEMMRVLTVDDLAYFS